MAIQLLSKNTVVMLAALSLAACTTVGPNYHKEMPVHPVNWSEKLNAKNNMDIEALKNWWTLYNDPTLNQLVQIALDQNQDLNIARQRVIQAKAERQELAGTFRPQVGLNSDVNRQRSSRVLDYPPGIGISKTYQLGLGVAWEIDLFGEQKRQLESADAKVEAIQQDQYAVMVSLLAELASQYIELQATQQRLDIANQTLQNFKRTEQFNEKRFKAGLGTTQEIAQSRSERERHQAKIPALQARREQLMHSIALLTGNYTQDIKPLMAKAQKQTRHRLTIPNSVPSEVMQNRPDIQAAERRLASSYAQIGVVVAENFPHLTIPLSLSSASSSIRDLFSAASIAWSIGLSASKNIYDGGKNKYAVQAAKSVAEIQKLEYVHTVKRAFKEVEDVISDLNSEQIRQQSLSAALKDSRTALNRSERLYKNGLTDYLTVLNSQRANYQIQEDLVSSELAYKQQTVALYKALGMGWQNSQTTTAASISK